MTLLRRNSAAPTALPIGVSARMANDMRRRMQEGRRP
jgi:hypothetical protein